MSQRFVRHVAAAAVIAAIACGFPAASSAADPAAGDEVDVLISYKKHPKQADHDHVSRHGGKVKRSFWIVPTVAARISKKKLAALTENPNVQSIDPDVEIRISDAELDSAWGVKRIGSEIAHVAGRDGAGVKVAVIDTGIDYRHPDLDGNYKGGWDFVNNDADPLDDNGHGTHCAGIIGAEDNGTGVVGVAPRCELYALKVMNASGSGSFSSIIAAVQWCIQNGIQVTSNSYGATSDPGTVARQAFDNAAALGIVMVAAAGNSGTTAGTEDTVNYPAKFGSAMAVAATTSANARATFSSTGPAVEIAAPGSSILSTLRGGGYGYMSGTSMACPHVAGAAAVLISAGLTDGADVRLLLDMSALDLGTAGRDTWYGYGLADLATALSALEPAPPADPQPEPQPDPEPPPPATASVDAIAYTKFGGKRNDRNLGIEVDIVDEYGDPIPNATVSIQVRRSGKLMLTAQGTTDGYGAAMFVINGAKGGTYTTTITSVQAAGCEWDGVSPPNSYVK